MGGFDVVDPRYRALFDRAVAVLGRDARVLTVGVSGSIATGTADAYSDLDLQVVTEPEAHGAFLSEWQSWLAQITPTVFARTPIAPFIINTVTADGLTFDLAVYGGHAPEWTAPATYQVGLLSRPFAAVDQALDYAVAEQLRGLAGPFITLVQREEHMRNLTGVPHLLGLLTTVFLAENNGAPPGKLWNEAFSHEQRATVAGLPPARATREDMMAFVLGLAQVLLARARPLFAHYALEWPGALAAVAAARLHEHLGVETSGWLH